MSEKISEYATSVTALASGDLMDVSKLISTSPDIYQSQKLNYSLLLTELNADLTINNLGNSNLTSTTNERYFKLNGDATTNLLRVQNDSNQSIVQFRGDRSILIDGYTTNGFVKTSAGTGLITVSTQVSATEGGTGRSSWTANALPYISATNTFNEILAGTNGHVLTMVAGVPSWAAISAPNLGSSNLTSSSASRVFKLQSNDASSSLFFSKLDGTSLLQLYGNGVSTFGQNGGYGIDFDPYGTYTTVRINMHPGPYYAMQIKDSGNNQIFNMGSYGDFYANRPSGLSSYINSSSLINFKANSSSSGTGFSMNNGTNDTLYLTHSGGHGIVEIKNSSGVTKAWLAGNNDSYFLNNLAVGVSSASARFHIVSSGSTSATTTALFQNSASVSALKVKDDGYCILKANNAAIASGDLGNNEMSFYIDEATNHCVVKVKYSSGTVKTGTFNLT